jgi:hypothetical protein
MDPWGIELKGIEKLIVAQRVKHYGYRTLQERAVPLIGALSGRGGDVSIRNHDCLSYIPRGPDQVNVIITQSVIDPLGWFSSITHNQGFCTC